MYKSPELLKEQQRRRNNLTKAQKDGLPIITQFCEDHDIEFSLTEGTVLDWDGVDYILHFRKEEQEKTLTIDLNTAFRVIYSKKKIFFLRYSGAEGGESEAVKILNDSTKAEIYATYEMSTKILRFYRISTIKEWLLGKNRMIHTGYDGSRYFEIPFKDIKVYREFQM